MEDNAEGLMREASHWAQMVEDLAADMSYQIEEEKGMAMGQVQELIDSASRLLMALEDLDNTAS